MKGPYAKPTLQHIYRIETTAEVQILGEYHDPLSTVKCKLYMGQ